jgi:protein-S-isoprenylcysteine O-methyltransferase Ste14
MHIGTFLLAISVLWLGSEVLLVRFRRSKSASTRHDRFTFWYLWLAIAAAVGGAIYCGTQQFGSFGTTSTYAGIAGIVLIVAGICVRWMAIVTLKHQFTVDVAIVDQHKLITNGIYRYLRHPAYAGTLLSFLGLGLAFANWISLACIIVLVPLAFLRRIQVEERVLRDQFGMDYERYCATTRRLVPFLY